MATPETYRQPLPSQRNIGSDMTMFFFIQPGCPQKFPSSDQSYIRGLNSEAISKLYLPAPAWLQRDEFQPLRTHRDDDCPGVFFSLNLSIYKFDIIPDEWRNTWFFMFGRVHLYALTWEIEQVDGLEEDVGNTVEYTIPAMVIRDFGYQPVSSRCFAAWDRFPMIYPIVSFVGPIVNSGTLLLKTDKCPGLDCDQLRCSGFVTLSIYLGPGKANAPPYTGFHPFQVFVLFPIHVTPWQAICQKMVDRPDT
ncbi:hypothetical protein EDB80DRAFT_620351, partial [Ilyonectria destructans]